MVAELNLKKIGFAVDNRGHIVISAAGQEEEFVVNLLAREYGKVPDIHEVVPESKYIGQLLDVGKVGYGLYTDIGMKDPRIDALIPLHRLREQMGMQGHSLRTIVKHLVLVDNLPVEVTVTEINIGSEQVGAEFSSSFLQQFDSWMNDDHERLLVFGANRQMIENALRQTSHTEDIYQIEKLGFFEFSLQCKRSTRASGILAAIGPKLQGVPMHLFIPNEVEAGRSAKT